MTFADATVRASHWIRENRAREAWVWCAALALSGAAALAWDRANSASAHGSGVGEASEEAATDTFIPAGFVLVPIQVSNYESLDSILGRQGVVDLFLPAPHGRGPARRVAERVRILRSPKDPSHFAVLAPESQSRHLVTVDGAFFVAVQNPKRVGAAFEKERTTSLKPSRLHVEQIDEPQPDP